MLPDRALERTPSTRDVCVMETRMRRWPFLAVTILAAAGAVELHQPGIASAAVGALATGAAKVDGAFLTTGGDGKDWPAVGYSYWEQRFSPLDQINAGNVGQLGIAWSADLPDQRGVEATPVIVDGVLYQSGPWSKVWAFDAVTGAKLWEFDPEVRKERLVRACCDAVNRGVAVWKGKVFLGTLDGRLIALDAASGKQLWSTQTTDPAKILYDHRRAARREGHGDHRQWRRRVRRAWLRHRL